MNYLFWILCWYSPVPLWCGQTYQDITHNNTMLAAADDKSDFKFTTDTPYLALTASYGVFLWGFWRKLTHIHGASLVKNPTSSSVQGHVPSGHKPFPPRVSTKLWYIVLVSPGHNRVNRTIKITIYIADVCRLLLEFNVRYTASSVLWHPTT